MFISRGELHRRMGFDPFNVFEVREEYMSVDMLLKEAKADSGMRNHEYMFDGSDLKTLPLKEDTSGILKKFPDIKTEAERFNAIKKEFEDDSYEPVPVFRDIDNPYDIFLINGFHRIVIAAELKRQVIKTKSFYGKLRLDENIDLNNLIHLLEMLTMMFKDKEVRLHSVLSKLREAVEKDSFKGAHWSIGYGNCNDKLISKNAPEWTVWALDKKEK